MAYVTAGTTVYAQIVNGVCLSELIPVSLIIINTVSATPTQYPECDDGSGVSIFDLTTIDNIVSNNSGVVSWYWDSLGTNPINPVDSVSSGDTTVYARVTAGPCVSDIVPVELMVLSSPQSMGVALNLCGDTSAMATFDLTSLDTVVSGNVGNVSWFADSALSIALMMPEAFLTGDTTVYAVVSIGSCVSDPAAIVLNIADGLTANPVTLGFCIPAGDTMFIDLLQYNSAVAGNDPVNWYLDSSGSNLITAPDSFPGSMSTTIYAASTDGICESELVPVDLFILATPVSNTFTISKCGQPGEQVVFDLISIDSFISENTGNVSWYIDGALSNPVLNSNAFLSGDSVVYALVTNGFCISGPVAVTLDVTDSLLANSIIIQSCQVNTDTATINLTFSDGAINGGSGAVIWFTDSLGMDTIFNPTVFVTTGDTVYAVVSADGCISNVAMIPIEVASSSFPTPACGFSSIDSLTVLWSAVTDEFSLIYAINGSVVGSNQVTTGNQFNLGGLGQGDTLTLWVTALFDSICTMPLTDSIICITDVCPLQTISITPLSPVYCRDDNAVSLVISPTGGQLTGQGIAGNMFIPGSVPGNSSQIQYIFQDIATGCVYDTSISITINDPLAPPVLLCTTPVLDAVTFDWLGTSANYGYAYAINEGPLTGPIATNNSSQVFSNLEEGDSVTLSIWALGSAPCGNSDTVTLTCYTKVCPPANINILNPGLLCSEDNVIPLQATVTGLPGTPAIKWFGSGIVDSSGTFDPKLALPGINVVNVIIRQDGCVYPKSGNIVVTANPDASLSIIGIPCVDSIFQVSFNGTTYPGAAEYWNFDFAHTFGGSAHDWNAYWTDPGDKLVIFAFDHQGCVDTFFAPITIDAPLAPLVLECVEEDYFTLTISWEPIIGANQYTVNTSAGQSVISGNSVTVKNLPDNTTVNISVTATGSTACGPSIATIDCQTLEYIPPRLFIPNVFSPNQDGINDIFYLQANAEITDINTLRIFDRWGNVVFEKSGFKPDDPSQGWDGYFKGKLMNPDVFTYWVEYKTKYDTVETKAGDVTLVR